MKKLLAFLVIPLLLTGCIKINTISDAIGSGNMKSETRDVTGYDSISISGMGTAEIIQGDKEGVVINADDNLLPYITTEVRNGRLHIGMKPGTINFQPTRSILYTIYVKNLVGLDLSGAVDTKASSLKSESLHLELSGAGSLDMKDIDVTSLKVDLSGATKVTLTGVVVDQDLELSGAGSYQAEDLVAVNTTVNLSGASAVTVNTSDRLSINASGTGVVTYYGSPKVSKTVSGMVVVKSLGVK